MPIDPYEPCPCGSGERYRFCCHKLGDEVGRVERLVENQQYTAALRKIDELQQRFGDNPWLLEHRLLILRELERWDDLEQAVEATLAARPNHATALILRGVLALRRDDWQRALAYGQDAFERAQPYRPQHLADLAISIALGLLKHDAFAAGLGHVELSARLDAQEHPTDGMVRELRRSRSTHLLLRAEQELRPAPDSLGNAQRTRFDRARQHAERGAWRAAAPEFEAIAQATGAAEAWYNAALCRLRIHEPQQAGDDLDQFARAADSHDEAVEAEALRYVLAADQHRAERVEVVYPLRDFDAARRKLAEQDRLIELPVPPRDEDESPEPEDEVEEPSPDAAFRLLDRAMPEPDKVADLASVPLEEAMVLLDRPRVGKQPRLSVVAWRGERLERACAFVRELLDDALGQPAEPDVVHDVPDWTAALSWPAAMPPGAPPEVTRRCRRQWFAKAVRDRIETPQPLLGGRSLRDAAGDPSLRLVVEAAVLAEELSPYADGVDFDWAALRSELGLPQPPPIPAEGLDVAKLPVARLHRLPADPLEDSQLVAAFSRAVAWALDSDTERFALALLARPHLKDKVDFGVVHAYLVLTAGKRQDYQAALDWVARGREFDRVEYGQTDPLKWDMHELPIRLALPDDPQLEPLVEHLWNDFNHLPQVREHVLHMLITSGRVRVVPADEAAQARREPALVLPQGTAEGGIWTPGGEQAPGKSKLWLPGQE